MRHAVEGPTDNRDLFAFRSRPDAAPRPQAPIPALPTPPPLPTFIGVAEDGVAGIQERTAIVTFDDQLLFVREGEVIGGVWIVEGVNVDTVQLTDGSTGTSALLTLP